MTPSTVHVPVWVDSSRPRTGPGAPDAVGAAFVDFLVVLDGRQWHGSFLIDTGATHTMLSASDAQALLGDGYGEIDFGRDPRRVAIGGIVGTLRCVARNVQLAFRTDEGRWHEIGASILIPEISHTSAGRRQPASPSLLGRDILGRGALTLVWQLPAQLEFSSLPPPPPALR